MAYDFNRCPQNEQEAQDFFYALIGREIGTPANDWAAVMSSEFLWNGKRQRIPPGPAPDVRLGPDAPFWGLTQQWSGGPKARIFLPTAQPDVDENGNRWYTRNIQYIKDAPGGGFEWTWFRVGGHDYAPVAGPGTTVPPVTPPPTTPPSNEAELLKRIEALEGDARFAKEAIRDLVGALRDLKDTVNTVVKLGVSPEDVIKLIQGQPVQVRGSIGYRDLIAGSKVTWSGVIGQLK